MQGRERERLLWRGESMKILRVAAIGTLLLTGTSGLMSGQHNSGGAQSPMQNPVPMGGQSGMGGLPSITGRNDIPDPLGPRMQEQQSKSRNSERQKRLVEDTARLLALAADLKQQMGNANKDAMSADMVKKAEEIERLARSVKDRMKG
jgi:hypothetical protein